MTSYFLVGMSGGAAEFFLFLVLFLCVALAGSAIGRCLAYALPTGTYLDASTNYIEVLQISGILMKNLTLYFFFTIDYSLPFDFFQRMRRSHSVLPS